MRGKRIVDIVGLMNDAVHARLIVKLLRHIMITGSLTAQEVLIHIWAAAYTEYTQYSTHIVPLYQ